MAEADPVKGNIPTAKSRQRIRSSSAMNRFGTA